MKRCPQCESLFPDEEKFCENDGSMLVTETAEPELSRDRVVAPQRAGDRSVQIILTVAAVIFGVLLVFGYLVITRRQDQPNQPTLSSSESRIGSPRPLRAILGKHRFYYSWPT